VAFKFLNILVLNIAEGGVGAGLSGVVTIY
jgi:hypothetical protein